MSFYRDRYLDHLEFLLPNGAIDNSWGSRHNKWTWWGSRTSDGAIEGLALLLDEPVFAKATEKVLSLYEQCTHDGLLSLPMVKEAGEPTCLHHSFCHAKALAVLAISENIRTEDAKLPVEEGYGIKFFQQGNLALISHNNWRATVSACDICCYNGAENGGGSLTLLMHGTTPVCASTMHAYEPSEPLNMQYLRRSEQSPCMTPRLDFGGRDNITDNSVSLKQLSPLSLEASGESWKITYDFGEKVTITVESEKACEFILPIIRTGEVIISENCVQIGKISVSAPVLRCDPKAQAFNQVGGFIWQPISVPVSGRTSITIEAHP